MEEEGGEREGAGGEGERSKRRGGECARESERPCIYIVHTYCIALYCMTLYCIALIVLYCIVLYYIVLNHVVLYCVVEK